MLLLLFNVGSQRYALDSDFVVEVIPKVSLKAVPHVPPYMAGLLNYGGTPWPIVDLPMLVEERPCGNSMHCRIILLQHLEPGGGTQLFGLHAEKVTEITHLEKSDFRNTGVKQKDLPFLNGVYAKDDLVIQYFDVPSICRFLKDSFLG